MTEPIPAGPTGKLVTEVQHYPGRLPTNGAAGVLAWGEDDVLRVWTRQPEGNLAPTREVPLRDIRSGAYFQQSLNLRTADGGLNLGIDDNDAATRVVAALRDAGVRMEDPRHISPMTIVAALLLVVLAVVLVAVLS